MARFKCLGVKGSTYASLYFVFSEGAEIFQPWNDPLHDVLGLYPMMAAWYKYPTYLDTQVSSVVLVQGIPGKVLEGQAIEPAPAVEVKDAAGNKLKGVMCFATITSEKGSFLPLAYRREQIGIAQKKLFNAAAETDDDGVARFKDLALSTSGDSIFNNNPTLFNDSFWSIGMICDGLHHDVISNNYAGWYSSTFDIVSTVFKVELKRMLNTQASVAPYGVEPASDMSDVFRAVVRITDANGKGVVGKSVNVRPETVNQDYAYLVLPVEEMMEVSSPSGFAVVVFKVIAGPSRLKNQSSLKDLRVQFIVDGVVSGVSPPLTTRISGGHRDHKCHLMYLRGVSVVDSSTGEVSYVDGMVSPVTVKPGSKIFPDFEFFGQTFDTCTHFPDLLPEGVEPNLTRCKEDRRSILSTVSTDRRLLGAQKPPDEQVQRRLEVSEQVEGQRRLMSKDGSLTVEFEQAYSTVGRKRCLNWLGPDGTYYDHCTLETPGLPSDLSEAYVLGNVPTLREISYEPSPFGVDAVINGPAGDHYFRLKATINHASGKQECLSPPIMVRILNPIQDVALEGDAGEGRPFQKQILPGQPIDISIQLVPNVYMAGASVNRGKLAASRSEPGGISFRWTQVPMTQMPSALYGGFDTFSAAAPLEAAGYYKLEEIEGFDNQTWKLKARLTLLKPGIFGRFAITFASHGISSRPFTFEVLEPQSLELTVIREPGLGVWPYPEFPSSALLPQSPQVKVTSNGQPLESIILVATEETNWAKGIAFVHLYNVPLADGVGSYTSEPSDSQGIATFKSFAVPDGFGCTRFKFCVTSSICSNLVPETPLCFGQAHTWRITAGPPASLPIGRTFDSTGGTFEVEVIFPPLPVQFPWRKGSLLVRLMVTEAGGRRLTPGESFIRTSIDLEAAVCIFEGFKEPLGRCSDLEEVQSFPLIYRFRFKSFKWKSTSASSIRLMVNDLSGSGLGQKVPMPANFSESNARDKAVQCSTAVAAAASFAEARTTSTIQAETQPASAQVLLPPPPVVTVGDVFLVRLRIFTKTGSPLSGADIRVGIKSAATTSGTEASPSLLQSIGQEGNTLSAVSDGTTTLDPTSELRTSKDGGVCDFPISITRAATGTYQLVFQPEASGSTIILEGATFKVHNPISSIAFAGNPWGELEVDEFGEESKISKQPAFQVEVESSSGDASSLQALHDQGTQVQVQLRMKAVSKKRVEVEEQLKEEARQARRDAAAKVQEAYADIGKNGEALLDEQIRASGVFNALEDDFADGCKETTASALGNGNPTKIINASSSLIIGVAPPALSSVLTANLNVLEPQELIGQFVKTFSAGGKEMKSDADMKVSKEWSLTFDDLEALGNETYAVKKPLYYTFQPDYWYSMSLVLNGVKQGEKDFPPFKAVLKPEDPVVSFLTWFFSAIAGFVALLVLSTNTRKHSVLWVALAVPACVGLIVAVPFFGHGTAMFGSWPAIAITNLAVILIYLVYAVLTEYVPGWLTFEQKKAQMFEAYTNRKFRKLLLSEPEPEMTLFQNLKATYFRRLNDTDALFFPSSLFIAVFLGFAAFDYAFVKVVSIVVGLDESLDSLLGTAQSSLLGNLATINNRYYAAFGLDLPDESSFFMIEQLRLINDWFGGLKDAVQIGATIGCFLASIIILFSFLFTFYDFRRRILMCRHGKFDFEKNNSKIQYSTSFIGSFIAASLVSYFLIVIVCIIVALPFAWPLLWSILWSNATYIIVTFILPAVLNPALNFVMRKCLFTDFDFSLRPLTSIFFFWQTWLSLLAGVTGSFVRFFIGLVSLLFMLPMACGAITPSLINRVYLLDSVHKSYLGIVMIYHHHNNPIAVMAARRLLAIKARHEEVKAAGGRWTSSRSLLILLLIRFPHLRQYRKTALEQLRQIKEAEKAAKKKKPTKEMNQEADITCGTPGKPVLPPSFGEEAWVAVEAARLRASSEELQRRCALIQSLRLQLSLMPPDSPQAKSIYMKLRMLCSSEGHAGHVLPLTPAVESSDAS
eukprot:TRINITY_DN23583_c0_g1_i1.p1 TRINITY_DN23583_c0_g1~~TRINITY_DN23583_c0_g1_i1.p1  ORF type:complete len:2026 (+),score=318.32 TRINITY_DN23583_c0_g1_i1:88-6078(+)